ncbi:MAG: putative nucleotide-diphospho-sugar transferase [Luteolibacter sp.]
MPPLHVVYLVTSQGDDYYPQMTQASVISLKHWNPAAKVTLACDPETHRKLTGKLHPLLSMADDVLAPETPEGSPLYQSRYLKTRLGTLIDGPFLYLDGDTLIRRNLSDLHHFTSDCDIAASVNHSQPEPLLQHFAGQDAVMDALGWKSPDGHYYNGGVVYFAGTPASRAFAEQWHQRWRISSATGKFFDQPAFNATLTDGSAAFKALPISYNAQIKCNPSRAPRAAIWHYYASCSATELLHAPCAIENFLGKQHPSQPLDARQVIRMARKNHPWRHDHLLDYWVLHLLARTKSTLPEPARLWLDRQRGKAIQLQLRNSFPPFRSL